MFRSAAASSRAILRLGAASSRPYIMDPPLGVATAAGSLRSLLPSASLLRFPPDLSREYARGRYASEEEDEDEDYDDEDAESDEFEGAMDDDSLDDEADGDDYDDGEASD